MVLSPPSSFWPDAGQSDPFGVQGAYVTGAVVVTDADTSDPTEYGAPAT